MTPDRLITKNRPIISVRSRKNRKKREGNERWEGRNSIMEKDPFLWSRWVIPLY
jgi:hypothetical protein